MNTKLALTIDFGTQSLRVALINKKGDIVAMEKRVYEEPYFSLKKGYAEQHADYYYEKLVDAMKADFVGYEEFRDFLLSADKFGNNIEKVDNEAGEIASRVAEIVSSTKNYLGNSFRPDFSSPSTHLLYGYWVGATPDGRKSRDMLGYGVDPLYGSAENGLGFRMLSNMKMPFEKMNGGYASHLGIDPKYFTASTDEDRCGAVHVPRGTWAFQDIHRILFV